MARWVMRQGRKVPRDGRALAILREIERGEKSQAQIGREFGVTRARVSFIGCSAGMPRRMHNMKLARESHE